MRRLPTAVPIAAAITLALSGCGNFQQRAREAEDRIVAVEESAAVAQTAAAQNTARLIELQDRIDALEREVNLLQTTIETQAVPTTVDETR